MILRFDVVTFKCQYSYIIIEEPAVDGTTEWPKKRVHESFPQDTLAAAGPALSLLHTVKKNNIPILNFLLSLKTRK